MITLIMPSVTLFAQDARPYAFTGLFACLSVRFWLMRTRSSRAIHVVLLTSCLAAGIFINGYSATLLLVLLIGATILEIPFDLGTITQTMFWHPRTENDPAHRWLRDRISALAAGV